ncbi:MAG: hypothetical protein ABH851_04260 [Methanobacteriota archaeon]
MTTSDGKVRLSITETEKTVTGYLGEKVNPSYIHERETTNLLNRESFR